MKSKGLHNTDFTLSEYACNMFRVNKELNNIQITLALTLDIFY